MKKKENAVILEPAEATRVKQFNSNKWLFSLGGIGRDMSYQLISAFLLVYVQFGVSLELVQFTTLSLVIGVGGRIWDAINDPMMGAIIEGTHLKWGKFKPWILIGAIGSAVIIILMFNLRVWTGWSFVAFMIVAYLLWESTFTMNDIGYWAMLPSLSSKVKERNQVTMMTVVFAGVGAFIGQGLITLFTPGNVVKGYGLMSIIIAIALVAFQIMTTFGVKETPRTALEQESKISLKKMWNTIKKNDQVLWMALSLIFYSVGAGLLVALAYNLYYLEVGYDNKTIVFIVIFGACSLLANAIYPKLAEKFGRKKLQFYSALVAVFGYIGIGVIGWGSFLPFNLITMTIFGLFVFLGQTLFYMATIINMTNCVEYNEYTQGERNEAVVSTLRPFVAKFSSAIQVGIVTLVLTVSGVFGLSQNISTMESQKNYLSAMDTSTEQIAYLVNVRDCLYVAAPSDEAAIQQASAMIEEKGLGVYQIKPEYLKPLGDCKIFRSVKNQKDSAIELGVWSELKDSDLLANGDGAEYVYSMEIISGDYNAANLNFKSARTMEMRVWMRIAVCVVPSILILLALLIQHKKFKIDEKFYNEMLEELDKRREEAQGESQDDAVKEIE